MIRLFLILTIPIVSLMIGFLIFAIFSELENNQKQVKEIIQLEEQ